MLVLGFRVKKGQGTVNARGLGVSLAGTGCTFQDVTFTQHYVVGFVWGGSAANLVPVVVVT
jgi:hypothetical protein